MSMVELTTRPSSSIVFPCGVSSLHARLSTRRLGKLAKAPLWICRSRRGYNMQRYSVDDSGGDRRGSNSEQSEDV